MNVFNEATVVATYCACIALAITNVLHANQNIYAVYFLIGYIKHILGYFIFYDAYCNIGHACACSRKAHALKNKSTYSAYIPFNELILQSILEGCLFMCGGWLGSLIGIKNTVIVSAVCGFALHLKFELLGIHMYFCSKYCV